MVKNPSTETVLHTPGPWSIGKWNDHTNGYAIDAPSVHHIGTAHYLGGTARASANARLIAAAPDLLHALDCILWRHMEDEFIPTEFWDMAKEAVKKAKGA